MILVDTSVWIRILGPRPPARFKNELLLEVVMCLPVLQEILQGIRDDRQGNILQDRLLALPMVESSLGRDCFLEASRIYREGRKRGITIRSSTDCLIAAIAMKHRLPIWHHDRDFDKIASFTPLKLYD